MQQRPNLYLAYSDGKPLAPVLPDWLEDAVWRQVRADAAELRADAARHRAEQVANRATLRLA